MCSCFQQIIRSVLLTSPDPNAHQDCCFSRPPGSFKGTVRYLPLMRTNEGPKWSYYKASLNRNNTSGENTLQNGERDCSGSTVLITQHNLSCFFSQVLSLFFFLCPSTSCSFSFTNMHTFTHSFSPPPAPFSSAKSLVSAGAHAWIHPSIYQSPAFVLHLHKSNYVWCLTGLD